MIFIQLRQKYNFFYKLYTTFRKKYIYLQYEKSLLQQGFFLVQWRT